MDIGIREKRPGQGKTICKSTFKTDLNLDSLALDIFCSYVLSQNRNINRGQLIALRNLISVLDIDRYYKNDDERMKKLDFITKALSARLDYNLKNPDMILKHITGLGTETRESLGLKEVDNSEINWISQTVSNALKYSYLYTYADKIIDLCKRFKERDYYSKDTIVAEFESSINDIQAFFRRAKTNTSEERMFSLRDDVYEDTVKDFYDQLMNPTNKLRTGMQGLNEMLAGGFESGRTYMLYGLPGEGKSTSMLDIGYQIKKYNKDFKPKDPTKIPCVVILTMENSVRESFERLFNMSSSIDDISNFSSDEVFNIMKTQGELYISDDNPIDILIKYMPGNTVDTSYLYTLTEDLEDEGYEVICMIQDYVKKINSVNYHSASDVRIELGAVVNEFKTYAIMKDIPIISASQLNRDATKHIDEGRKATKADLVRLLGRSNIGESMLMLENIDAAFMIAPEWTDNGATKYLGIQNIKSRYKTSGRLFIYQPYVIGNSIKLIEDYYSPQPVFKETLSKAGQVAKMHTTVNPTPYYSGNIVDIGTTKLPYDEETNIFSPSNTIASSAMSVDINYSILGFDEISAPRTAPIRPLRYL